MDTLQNVCVTLVGHETPFTLTEKDRVSVAFGYFPARLTTLLYDTYGLSPLDQWPVLNEQKLKLDWGGFELEMARRGADVSGLCKEGRREYGQ